MAVSESKRRANNKYDEKTYRRYSIILRKEEDAILIDAMDEAKESGIPYRAYFTELLKGSVKEVVPSGLVRPSDVRRVLEAHRIDVRTINSIMQELGE